MCFLNFIGSLEEEVEAAKSNKKEAAKSKKKEEAADWRWEYRDYEYVFSISMFAILLITWLHFFLLSNWGVLKWAG